MQCKHLLKIKYELRYFSEVLRKNEMMKVRICFKNFLNVNFTLFNPKSYFINQIIVLRKCENNTEWMKNAMCEANADNQINPKVEFLNPKPIWFAPVRDKPLN